MHMLSKIIVALFAFSFVSEALHLHDTSSNYIQYLQDQQSSIKNKLDQLDQKMQNNYKSLENENDIDKKIALLQNYLKEQRLLLAGINVETFNQQLSSSEWVCPALSDRTKKQLNEDLIAIDKNLDDINKTLLPLTNDKTGPGVDNAKQQIKKAEKIVGNLKDILASTGNQVSPSSIKPDTKTNLNAPNWILDGKKVDDLNNEYKKSAESGTLEICSNDSPFFYTKENKCISCPKQKPFFSLRTYECVECYNFEPNEHKCKDNEGAATNIIPSTSDKIIVPAGKILDDYKKKIPAGTIICPEKTPFYTGEQCIQCEKYFDIEAKKCKNCDGSSQFDKKTNTCRMPEITVSNVDAGKESLIIPDDKSLNDINKDNKKLEDSKKVNVCPKDKPYFNNYECISCSEGTLFSLTQKTCGTCPVETFFNKATNHCQKKSFLTNLQDPNWSSTKSYPDIQMQIDEKAKDKLYEKCSVQKPFSIGKECIQCGKDEHFDYDKQKCDKCYNGQSFNKNLHTCTYSQSNLQTNPEKAPSLIFEGRPKNEWMYIYYQKIQQNDGMTDCPKQKPYFDGIGCILCPLEHPYFNLEYKMCQKCSDGTKYEETHHECLTTQGNIATQVPTLEKMAAGIFS